MGSSVRISFFTECGGKEVIQTGKPGSLKVQEDISMLLFLLKINQTLPGYRCKENLLVAVLLTLTLAPETAAPFRSHSSVTATTATWDGTGAEENCSSKGPDPVPKWGHYLKPGEVISKT